MTKQRDPNSKRTLKREKRSFTASRPERRAMARLSVAMSGYNASDPSYTKPGAKKYW